MKKFVKLPNSLISVEEKLTMAALLMSAKNDSETITTVAVLEALLTKKGKPNKKTQDTLFDGLKSLIGKEIIKVDSMPTKINELFEVAINVQEGTFTILYYDEIQKIMGGDYKGAVNRELFGYYVALASFYNNATKIAYPTIEQLSDKSGSHVKTVEKYNSKLQELEIIHIENNGLIVNGNNIQSLRNTYSRKDDIELCKEQSEKFKNEIVKKGGKLIERKQKKSPQQLVEDNIPSNDIIVMSHIKSSDYPMFLSNSSGGESILLPFNVLNYWHIEREEYFYDHLSRL